jgi:septum formation protein
MSSTIPPHALQATSLILASTSQTRINMLDQAGIACRSMPALVDEEVLKQKSTGLSPSNLALALATAKALSIDVKDCLIIGADQTLSCGNQQFSKAKTIVEARKQIMQLRGKSHQLHSAVIVTQNHNILFQHVSSATLTMRNFSNEFLENYLSNAGSALTNSIGCYHYEGLGLQLFEKVEGDYFTILGLPLLPLLAFLRQSDIVLT